MGKITLTNEDINNIIYLYQNKIPSTHKLAECFKVGHKKISKICLMLKLIKYLRILTQC